MCFACLFQWVCGSERCAFAVTKQSRINCTEEEKCPTCAVGGKLAQGQLMYRLSICTYFIPRLENKSCLCQGPLPPPPLQQAIAAPVEWKTRVLLMSFWVLCGGDRFNTTDKIKRESCSPPGQMSAMHYNWQPNVTRQIDILWHIGIVSDSSN